eukprot:TRINITY_DN1874_c4_g1_i1.p1 TRINITY_DN1874_c4_g1~~TRINITY_DN1874_c4_g1_i1.p1  ORF type:complete len:610 (+),score=141.31 TRINITY_DN1874_c4_g1_i1:45-1874(+)
MGMDAISGKLAVFSGKGANMASDLTRVFKEHTAIMKPFMETCAEALSECYPELYGDEEVVDKEFDLLEALEKDTIESKLKKYPAMSEPVSTISQLANFFLHMKTSGKGVPETEGDFVAASGDQSGLLSAIAFASSSSDADFGSNSATAVRAAFYAGLEGEKDNSDVAKTWTDKGIKFKPLRMPVLAGSDSQDLRESKNLENSVAELITGQDSPSWKKIYDKSNTECGVLGFGSHAKDSLKQAIKEVSGVELADWNVESAGVGGQSWESLGVKSTHEKPLLNLLREKCPQAASLPDAIFSTYPCPGDLLKQLEEASGGLQQRDAWQWSDVNWFMSIFLVVVHALAIYGSILSWDSPHFRSLWIDAWILYPVTGMLGITAGAHRLWAHRSYQAHFPARFVMMIANSIANQGTIYHWARDHRVHHAKSDTEADPHDITRGFFYSHMGWLMLKKRQAVKDAGKKIDCSDLLKDPLVRIQHVCDPFWNMFFCFAVPAIYAHYMYNEAWLGFLVIGAARWLLCLHATWTVNSVAHTFGSRPYTPNMYPSESWFTTLFAVGEGYHNWHHTYPYDYSASELGFLNCFNPTTAWIDGLALVGQVWGRKRAVHTKPKMA